MICATINTKIEVCNNNTIDSILSAFTLRNNLTMYSFATCIGVQEPICGDNYVGLGAVVLPCESDGRLNAQLIYGDRITSYYEECEDIIWGIHGIGLHPTWGTEVPVDDGANTNIRKIMKSWFSPIYTNTSFRYNFFTLNREFKSECVADCAHEADNYMKAIAEMVADRVEKINAGNR